MADAAAGAGDDHPLTALEAAMVEERLPRAEAGEGDRRAMDVVERLRLHAVSSMRSVHFMTIPRVAEKRGWLSCSLAAPYNPAERPSRGGLR